MADHDTDSTRLDDVRAFLADEHGLATVSTTQADGRVLSSVVNCGVMAHPVTGEGCVALVSRGDAARLGHIRRGSEVTVLIRRGWAWRAVTGPADIIGPDDAVHSSGTDFDAEELRLLMRQVYQAAGGDHDDYDEYDRVMAAERRAAVFVSPDRILGVG
ncbi:MAG: pyridoxamine 5'-phosphate oxidase [Acidimicrobiia bacterium]|nr:pyridoxamine 5'-phosphate oxidase [Acidimicrobiia bacterium]